MKNYSAIFLAMVILIVTLFVQQVNVNAYSSQSPDTNTLNLTYKTPTPQTIIIQKTPYKVTDTSTRKPYFPLSGCSASRLYIGDQAFVSLYGGPNAIRSTADTHPTNNVLGKAHEGEGLKIIDGPKCNYGWILWKVKTDSGLVGWTPESNGKEFWITPVETQIKAANKNRPIYSPIQNCASSRLYVGDRVYVSFGGGANAIRNTPDTHPSNNKIGKAEEGEGLTIIGGPVCNWGWILWKVQTDKGLTGWTPESDGNEFWLLPVDTPQQMPASVKNNATYNDLYQKLSSIMSDRSLSQTEKQNKVKVLQRNFGEEAVTTVIRYVPVFDTETNSFMTFDSYIRKFASEYGPSTSQAPIESDPTGAAMRIFNDPSPSTIMDMLGLD